MAIVSEWWQHNVWANHFEDMIILVEGTLP